MMLSWNIFLAFIWLAFWGEASFVQFFVGFILGFIFLWFLEFTEVLGRTDYSGKVKAAMGLVLFFCKELWKANIRVAMDIVRIHPRISPAIVAVPLDLKTPWAITTLANLITLTPGTLSLDLNDDSTVIFIHTMYLDNNDKAAFVAEIKNGFEARLLLLEAKSTKEANLQNGK